MDKAGAEYSKWTCDICGGDWPPGISVRGLIHICSACRSRANDEREVIRFMLESRGYIDSSGRLTGIRVRRH